MFNNCSCDCRKEKVRSIYQAENCECDPDWVPLNARYFCIEHKEEAIKRDKIYGKDPNNKWYPWNYKKTK
jgi:hypothetical protein